MVNYTSNELDNKLNRKQKRNNRTGKVNLKS